MLMQASVLDVQLGRLLVLDLATRQRMIVNTPDARWFRPGDLVRIWYDGTMTKSIPPQITALNITVLQPPTVFPPVVVPPVVRPPIFFPPPVVVPPFGRPPFGRPGFRPPHRRHRR